MFVLGKPFVVEPLCCLLAILCTAALAVEAASLRARSCCRPPALQIAGQSAVLHLCDTRQQSVHISSVTLTALLDRGLLSRNLTLQVRDLGLHTRSDPCVHPQRMISFRVVHLLETDCTSESRKLSTEVAASPGSTICTAGQRSLVKSLSLPSGQYAVTTTTYVLTKS